ncbi:MAG TPA: response regulator [Bdellovibrionota bacterium]|nr:response regulator [Bdellovibrionota bacterium]
MRPRVLIVEDDPGTCDTLETLLDPSYECTSVHTLSDARRLLNQIPRWNAVLLDLRLPDGSGDVLFDERASNEPYIIVLTGVHDLKRAIRLMAKGAFYYLTKDSPAEETLSIVARAVERTRELQRAERMDAHIRELAGQVESLRNSVRTELWHFAEASSASESLPPAGPLKGISRAFEKRFLWAALERNHWRKRVTAHELGIHLNTLLLKIKRHHIQQESPDRSK